MNANLRVFLLFSIAFTLAVSGLQLHAADPDKKQPPPIAWTKGPGTVKLGSVAEMQLPQGFLFADGDGARKYMELIHNPTSGEELGIIVPASEKESWFVLFEFNEVGLVKDDDKGSLDSAAILKNIQDGTESANEERKKHGWEAFHVNGWYTPPFYDSVTNNLTWATNGSSDNDKDPTVNYSVRLLGRRGTMNVDLVLDPGDMARVEPQFKDLMKSFQFSHGSRYADFVQGDKLAGYGLTALVAGGATAVAIKTGLLAKFWKLIVVGFAAAAGAIKKWWRKLTGKPDPNQPPQSLSE